jgi:hypothetical protein
MGKIPQQAYSPSVQLCPPKALDESSSQPRTAAAQHRRDNLHPRFRKHKQSPATLLKGFVVAIGNGGSRAEHKLAKRIFRLLPELRNL